MIEATVWCGFQAAGSCPLRHELVPPIDGGLLILAAADELGQLAVNLDGKERETGFEPATSSLGS